MRQLGCADEHAVDNVDAACIVGSYDNGGGHDNHGAARRDDSSPHGQHDHGPGRDGCAGRSGVGCTVVADVSERGLRELERQHGV